MFIGLVVIAVWAILVTLFITDVLRHQRSSVLTWAQAGALVGVLVGFLGEFALKGYLSGGIQVCRMDRHGLLLVGVVVRRP